MTEVLALIPARKNSKGLKNKNIKIINNHPLLAYSIEAAIRSKCISRVICSTDSVKIRKIANKYGAETPFLRPKKYSTDTSTDISFIKHALSWLKNNENYKPDLIIHLRPTSPIRYISHIDGAIKKMQNSKTADSLRAVSFPTTTPYKMWTIKNNYLNPLLKIKSVKEPYNMPRQKLPKIYVQTGYMDIIRYNTIIKYKSLTGKKILSYFVPEHTFIDIDNKFSFELAKIFLKNIKSIRPQ